MTIAAPRLVVLGLVAGIGVATMLPLSGSGVGQTAPMRVTTDTAEYCHQLDDRLAHALSTTSKPPSPEVEELASDGRRMCSQGEIRAGILRLRQALRMQQ